MALSPQNADDACSSTGDQIQPAIPTPLLQNFLSRAAVHPAESQPKGNTQEYQATTHSHLKMQHLQSRIIPNCHKLSTLALPKTGPSRFPMKTAGVAFPN